MKYQPLYKVGERVMYNSINASGAAHGTVVSVDNSKKPHVYTVQPDLFKEDPDKKDVLEEQHIFNKI